MTDPFEDAVRDALRGTTNPTGELPTYHGAWQRGRRRRMIKRSALAAAGAFVLVAALAVNLGRVPGGTTTDTSDVATGIESATAVFEPTPLATTAPVETPITSAQAVTVPTATPEPPDIEDQTATAETPTAVATAPPAAAVPQAVAPTAVPPTPVPPTAVPTSDPVPENATTSVPTPQPEAPTSTPPVERLPDSDTTTDQDPDSAAGTALTPADPGSPDGTSPRPQPAFTGGPSPDAVLLTGAARGVALPCDLNNDGTADATCELLPDYPCSGDGDVRPGYASVDTNGDGATDTCMALDLTVCDTIGDGQGDTPCIIDVSAATEG